MSTRRLLLCCGSRELSSEYGGTTESARWAMEILASRISDAQPRPDLLINGGAIGPDRWSSEIAQAIGIDCRVFALDGNVYAEDVFGTAVKTSRWRDAEGPAVSPLERNRAMVAAAVRARDDGWHVQVLGLVAPWSKTHGSDHCMGQARHCKLDVARWECPDGYGRRAS